MQATIVRNKLLTALPQDEYLRLLGHLEFVYLADGKELCRDGEKSLYVYFPTTMIVALQHEMRDGSVVEIGVIGREGMVGAHAFFDGCACGTATVQFAGGAYRTKSAELVELCQSSKVLRCLLMQYSWTFLFEAAKKFALAHRCSIDQRLSRWLLERLDRLTVSELKITHKAIASMLGVRRESVTQAMGKLQDAGLVRCRRGAVTILDRTRLECLMSADRQNQAPLGKVA